ncbi:MAG: cation transporter [Oscillospiraceae bacterium]|nr:cation transporter [Oscillospiraceae bacterium]
MKSERKLWVAFVLNLAFSLFEFLGGIYTGSVAILSDGLHDLGDAISIGLSWFFEKKSKGAANQRYTYGYGRFSLLGGLITVTVLLIGSVLVIYHAVQRLADPGQIRYNGMILFALVGVVVNGSAVFFTRDGESVNQKAVNLHMLEDVLGWIVVLVGAVVMKLTNFPLLDPILSIGVA